MADKTGGPAFPTNGGVTYKGMTLLDYFAGQAMQLYTITDYEDAAKLCYSRAEAMIKEREKRK
tara:strand:- start:261 stop:449 length:189 start_codon:yes stop_codon:yes gene_type:complete